MPTHLLSVSLNWFASHLVAFTLLGFLVVGLHVAGMTDLSRVSVADDAASATSAGDPASPVSGRLQTSTGAAAQSASGAPSDASPFVATEGLSRPTEPVGGPRLIGGILPVQDAAGLEDGFRPSGQSRPSADEAPPDYLQQARRAFWNGDFEGSEAAYMSLIGAHPGDGNAFGELGNLYQSMNRPGLALDAYFEAGVRFRAAGDSNNLNQIIEVLRQQGDGRAHELTR